MASQLASGVAGTAAFSKFMTVLQLVADAAAPPGAAELARLSGFPRATVYRIVAALLEHGMVLEPAPGVYAPGPRLINLASRCWAQLDVRTALAADLQALRDVTGETVHLAVPSGGAMIYIEKLESPGPLRMASRVGARLMLHSSAVGKAYLASLDPAACEALLAGLPMPALMAGTITALPAMRAELARVRAQGYAVDNEENEAGIVCYGVAVRDASGRAVAGVSVSTLQLRRRGDARAAYIEPLLKLRDAATARLSGAPGLAGSPNFP